MELKQAQLSRQQPAPPPGAAAESARLAEIEMLRATAVLMVLVGHVFYGLVFWPSHFVTTYIMPSGLRGGVDLFFAISGFVIARALLPRLAGITDTRGFILAAQDFWIARAWRLLPSAWLWLTMPLILSLAFNRTGVFGPFESNWAMFIAGLLFLGNFHLATAGPAPFTAFPQWSLSLEEQFYFILPLAAFFLRRYLVGGLALIVLAGFLVPNTPLTLAIRLWPVALGVLLAIWSRHPSYQHCAPTGLARHPVLRAALFILLLACLISTGAPDLHIVPFYQGVVAVISGLLVWLASYDRNFLSGPGPLRRVMEFIAARSYSLYLVHIPVYCSMCELWRRWYGSTLPSHVQQGGIFLAAGAAVLLVAELNHRLLETPLRNHGKRLVTRRRAARAAT
jgi:peptidoglycan/LPS O-acetylase OafA/YrhL